MPLVDLDDPAELRARWSALAAVAHATGFDRRWYADDNGWYHQDETGSDLRMVRLDGARAVLFGFHTQHSRTGGADLLAGSPEWIGQPEVKRRMAAGQLGFVYGSFNGTWARAAYPGDPWQPLDDGFAPIAQWVTSDEEAARELIEWAAEWADYLGGLDELQPIGVALIRTAGSSGLTAEVLRDLFERLGIGPRSPQDPDLRAALVAAAQFGDGVVAEGALNAETLGRSGRMSAAYTEPPGQGASTGYAESPGQSASTGYAESPGQGGSTGYAEAPRSGESAGYAEPAGYAQAPGRAEPAGSPGYAEPAGYGQPAESTGYGQPSEYAESAGPGFAGAGETTGYVEPVDDDVVEEELFVVPPGVSPFTGQLIAEGDQMIGEPFTAEPPFTPEPPFPAEPPMRPDPPFTPDPPPYQPEPEPEPRREPEGYGVTGKKPRRFGRKKKHEDGDPLAVLGLVGPAEPPEDQHPYEQPQYGQGQQPYEQPQYGPGQQPYEQAQYGPGQPHGSGDYGQGQQYGLVDQGQGQPYGQDQRGQGQPGPAPYEQPQYGQPSYGQDQYEPEGEPSPEHYLGDRRLPSAEPPRVGGPVEDGEDFYASLFADAPAAASYTPDVPTDAVPNWSADAPSPFTPLTNTPPSPSDDTGVLPPLEDTDPAHAEQQPPGTPYAEQQPATPEARYAEQQPAGTPESLYAEQQAAGTQEAPRDAEHLPAEPQASPFAATTHSPQQSPYPATDPAATHAPQQPAPSGTPTTGPQTVQAAPSWSSGQASHTEQPTARHDDQAGPARPADHPQASAGQVVEAAGAGADALDDDDAPTAEIEAVMDAPAGEADEDAADPAQVSPEQLASDVDAEAGAGVAENRGAGIAEARRADTDGGGDRAAGEADDTAAIPAVVDDDEAEEEYYPTDVSPFAPVGGESPFAPASEAVDDDGHGRELPLVTNGFSTIDPTELQPGESGYEFGGEVFHDELIGEGDWTADQLGDFQPPTPQPTTPENTSPTPAPTPAPAHELASTHELASGPSSASPSAPTPDPTSAPASASASAPAPASAHGPASTPAPASGPTSTPDTISPSAPALDSASADALASEPDLMRRGGTPPPDSRRETELRGDAASMPDTAPVESSADVEVTAEIEAIRDDGPDQQSEEARSAESFEVDHRYDSLDAPMGRVEDGRSQDERLEAEDDFAAEQVRAEWGGQAEGPVEGERAGEWIEPVGPQTSADSAVRAAPPAPATSAERDALRAAMSAERDAPEGATPGEPSAREYAPAATVQSAEQGESTPPAGLAESTAPAELAESTAPAELVEPTPAAELVEPAVERLVAPPASSGGVAIPGLGLVGADSPRVEPLPGSIEEAMRSEYERPRPRPKESAALDALREWCRARTRIVPSGFTIQVQVLDPDNPSYRFDLEPPEVDDPQYGADRLAGLLGDLWLAESQSEQGAWLFARLDAAGRTLRIDRWYDQVPEWWDHPIEQRLDVLGLVRRLNGRGPDWQPSYLEKLYTTAR